MNMTLLLTVFVFFVVCLLLMSVGVIIRNKSFKSCGCASIEFNGEKIKCPGCCDDESEATQKCCAKDK